MKLTVSTARAKAALAAAGSIISPKALQPVLSNAVLKAAPGCMEVFAANDRMTVALQVAADVKEGGVVTIPAKRVAVICSEVQGDVIEISSLSGGYRVDLAGGSSRFRINAIPAEQFTVKPHEVAAVSKLVAKQSDLGEALEAVSRAVGHDDGRPALKGVLFQWEGEFLTLVATDGRRLIRSVMHVGVSGSARFIVPDRAVVFLLGILGKGAQVTIAADSRCAHFSVDPDPSGPFVGKIEVSLRLVEGDYPDYKRAIPTGQTVSVVVNRADMLAALSRASLICSPKHSSVALQFSSEGVRVSVKNPEMGESDETVAVSSMKGDALHIRFNPQFLIDSLSGLAFDEVCFQLSHPAAPLKIEVGDRYTAVVMPVRLE